MEDDDKLFAEAMKDVQPIKKTQRLRSKDSSVSGSQAKVRRQAATAENELDRNPLTGGEVPLLDAYYPLSYKRDGVQNGVFRKLKQGKYEWEARLDLHRHTVDQAREAVFDFIKQSAAYDLRVVIIVHGRGSHNASQQSVIKSYVDKWLPELDEVQAYCSAQPQHGGVGAVYVQLKKSERQKQANRERFTRGRPVS